MSAVPPDDVKAGALRVEQWLAEQATARLPAEEIAKLTPAQRLDYARLFPQDPDRMPAWRDPRKGG